MKCSKLGCTRKVKTKNLCSTCYQVRWAKLRMESDPIWAKNERERCKIKGRKRYYEKREESVMRANRYQRTPHGRYLYAKRYAKKQGIPFILTEEQYQYLCEIPACAYCAGDRTPTGIGLDRKDSNGGYEIDNVVPCCRYCNNLKHSEISFEEMTEIIALLKCLRGRENVWSNN